MWETLVFLLAIVCAFGACCLFAPWTFRAMAGILCAMVGTV